MHLALHARLVLGYGQLSALTACLLAGTVWLYGDFIKQGGILGFLQSARKEYKGNSVRTLIGWDQPDLDFQKARQSVAHLDLCVNVIKDSVNGMYMSVQTEVSLHC